MEEELQYKNIKYLSLKLGIIVLKIFYILFHEVILKKYLKNKSKSF